jgi:hypothetical protein
MNDSQNDRWPAYVVAASVVALALCGLLASCRSGFTPRQGWNRANGPVVPHDKFPADCSLCHTGGNWTTIRKDFSFDHARQTGYELKGAHADVGCLMCHNDRGDARAFAAGGCAGCHIDVHRARLGRNCSTCHTEQTWQPVAVIARHNRTRFPLVGAHATTACFACHPGAQVGNFEGADPRCLTCHRADLAKATSPDHSSGQFNHDCQRCHQPTGWKPALFNHPAAFPLVGGHAAVGCTACHTSGTFTALPTDCASCHIAQYQATTNPNHAASGFDTNCKTCHSVRSWLGAKFNHPADFPLTGGHGGIACSSCHKGGTFTGLSTACVFCHLSNYQQTTNPNHAAAGFGTNCQTCHGTASWAGASFTHTAFPLSGPHQLSCDQCHTNLNQPQMFVCTACHAHDQASMTARHSEVGGFVWDSAHCYQCHRRGIAGDVVHPRLVRPKR